VKKIAVIGAGYMQLPLVLKAGEMNLQTICFAWEEGAVCRDFCTKFFPVSILDKAEILRICREEKIDGIISIASDAAVPTVTFVAARLGLVSNRDEDSLQCTDKYAMRRRFKECGMVTPEFVFSEGGALPVLNNLRLPFIVKPVDRSGSRGVTKIIRLEELAESIAFAANESFKHNVIIEEFIPGEEVSVETISWQGTHYILAITDKVTSGDPHFIEIEHHQPSHHTAGTKEKIVSETLRALDALNIICGAGHSEFKITPGGEVICLEVGARMGGDFIGSDLVRLSAGYDFLRGVIEVATGSFTIPEFSEEKYSGVVFICEETKHSVAQLKESYHDRIVSSFFPGTENKKVRNGSDRQGYIIYKSDRRLSL
jgi:biotin carboxylase